MSLLLPAAVAVGILVGRYAFPEIWLEPLQSITMGFLYLLLVGIGINLAADSDVWILLRKIRPLALLVIPLSALGSILGAALVMFLLDGSFWLGASIGAGFGWYSLSSVLLAGELGATVGTLAFLTNTLRELLAMLLIPAATKRFGVAGVTLGGATTMDTTLALISQAGDQQLTFIALLHGISLSSLVPLLVPLLAQATR